MSARTEQPHPQAKGLQSLSPERAAERLFEAQAAAAATVGASLSAIARAGRRRRRRSEAAIAWPMWARAVRA